jgi:hypothetical protein
MHPYLGDFDGSQTVHLAFNSSDLGAAPITLDGTPALQVYRDDGDTEDNSGITLDVDSDGRTGFHRAAIDLSSDGTFYADGHDFFVVITTGTVDAISVVGKVVAHFSKRNRSAHAVIPDSMPAVGDRPTPEQALLFIDRALKNRAFVAALLTVFKEDGTTPAATFTANSATVPTEYERTT